VGANVAKKDEIDAMIAKVSRAARWPSQRCFRS
jgi:hypothetical protein